MAHVFLSHSSADATAAKVIAQLLQNAGLDVWLELDQLKPGNPWLPDLEAALKASTHFVVLVGETGVQRWVEREVRYALERNTADPNYRVIPLLGPGAKENDLPLFLKQQQYLQLDSRQPDPGAIQRVAAAILNAPPERVSVLPAESRPSAACSPSIPRTPYCSSAGIAKWTTCSGGCPTPTSCLSSVNPDRGSPHSSAPG